MTPHQCIHYALTRPAVASVLAGARTLGELESCLAYESASDAERDYAAAFAAMPKISWEDTACTADTAPPCPVGIDVATVTKFWRLATAQGEIPETVREHYAALPPHSRRMHRLRRLRSPLPLRRPRAGKYEAGGGALREITSIRCRCAKPYAESCIEVSPV